MAMQTDAPQLLPALRQYCAERTKEFDQIAPERREQLLQVTRYIQNRDKGDTSRLLFICTHNSRRSQFGQVWARVAAAYYHIERIETFSGGTEATACNERTVAALQRAGLTIEKQEQLSMPITVAKNPRYAVFFAKKTPPFFLFSKKYDDSENPQRDFCAIPVCSSADQACPVVPGAALRVYVGYEDPKVSDGSPEEAATYDERCRQIAREWLFVFSQLD